MRVVPFVFEMAIFLTGLNASAADFTPLSRILPAMLPASLSPLLAPFASDRIETLALFPEAAPHEVLQLELNWEG